MWFFGKKKNKKGIAKKDGISVKIRNQSVPQIPIVFMGTPEISRAVLAKLLDAKYRVVGAVTQPDKPMGRKQELTPSPVKKLATEKGIPLLQPTKLDDAMIGQIAAWKPDLIIVAAYGKILPEKLLSVPGLGCLNVHTSLLPRWRGASPVQNALMAGDTETGITLMLMDKGMDTGDIIAQKTIQIFPDELTSDLLNRLTEEGAEFLIETLPSFIHREIVSQPQPKEGVTLCQLIEREDGRVFWNAPAEEIYNRYRGLSPWPGLFTYWKRADDTLRIKLNKISLQKTNPIMSVPEGTVIEVGEKIGVQCGTGVIFLEEVQLEGKNSLPVREFLNGNPDFVGSLLT